MTENRVSLDHIGIVAPDLSALEQRYRVLGFRVAPRCELIRVLQDGSMEPLGQVNSHLVFENSYVELTAVTGDLCGHHLEQALVRYWGFHIVALLARDAAAQYDRLCRAGLHPDTVAIAGRSIDYPGGSGMGRFRWFRVPDAEAPEAFFCFVQHLTPDLVFDPALNDHPNGACELTGFTLCVDDPAASAGRLAGICGATAKPHDSGFELALERAVIRITGPHDIETLYGATPIPPVPFAAAFRVRAANLEATATYFADAGIKVEAVKDGLIVPPMTEGDPAIEFER